MERGVGRGRAVRGKGRGGESRRAFDSTGKARVRVNDGRAGEAGHVAVCTCLAEARPFACHSFLESRESSAVALFSTTKVAVASALVAPDTSSARPSRGVCRAAHFRVFSSTKRTVMSWQGTALLEARSAH
eukprot:4469659-Pleurochrysis_carterae.AAC.1